MHRDDEKDERDVARLLRAAGRRPEMPGAMKARLESHFRRELADVIARRRLRRRRLLIGAAASLAAGVFAVALLLTPPSPEPSMVARLTYLAGTVTIDGRVADGTSDLRPGVQIHVGRAAALAIDLGGYDVRLRENSRARLLSRGIGLDSGVLFAGSDRAPGRLPGLEVRTPHGRVSDIGTQFIVATNASETRATVRRGALRIDRDGDHIEVASEGGRARYAAFDKAGNVEVNSAPARGEGWDWIHRAAAPFVLEGASAFDFLAWVARESGLALRFASSAAEINARTTTLHGDLGEIEPLAALTPVLLSTELSAQVSSGGELRVSLKASR